MSRRRSGQEKGWVNKLDDMKVTIGHSHDPPTILRKTRRRQRVGNLKPMRFVSLHHHTTFSYLDGYQMPEAHIRRAAELNMNAIAFTEHGNIASHVKAEKAAENIGVRPLFGCELYTGRVGEGATQSKYHLTVLAKNAQGYRNLIQLVTRSWAEGFYYDPTVSMKMLRQHREGLIILSGCQGSLLACSLTGGKLIDPADASLERGLAVARRFLRAFGEAYFPEVQAFPELEKACRLNPMVAEVAQRIRRPLVATMDCHYTTVEENELQQILHNVRGGGKKTLEEQAREWGYDVPLCPPPNDNSIYRKLRGTGLTKRQAVEAIATTAEIAQECNVELPKLPMVRFPVPHGFKSAEDVWDTWLREGWFYRGCDALPRAERVRYKAQLRYERGIIEHKDFIHYHLIISDLVKFAKDAGIPVGPARGSAAGSLVCWLLRITEVNPMLFPLLVFERYIDMTRDDLPDIDLDFASEGRPAVRDYAVAKYGRECVSNVGTFTGYKAKNSLDDVGRVYGIPIGKVEQVKELLLERSSGDLRASATIEDTVAQFDRARVVFEEHPELARAMDLEGNVKGQGVHSAGLVISNGPITDVCSFMVREVPKGSGNMLEVATLDKYDAERQGLIKMDLLGLSTMSMINTAIGHLGMSLEDLYGLPLEDPRVISAFRRKDVVGIFQFDGRATRNVCGSIKPDSFSELCDINALSRPGPLHNGAAQLYAEIKHDGKRPDRLHPALEAITSQTKFQIVYQEQILRIVKEIGGFDWTHASEIRRIIARKIGEAAFNREWQRFQAGAVSLHKRSDYPPMSEDVAERIWGMCTTAGAYAFNAAHSVSYTLLAVWCQWIKQYHPAVFYASALAHLPNDKEHDLLRDGAKHHVKFLPPHPDKSDVTWRPVRKKLARAGLVQIPGISHKTAEPILEARRQAGGFSAWNDLAVVRGIGAKTVEKVKAFVKQDDPFNAFAIDRNITKLRKELPELGLPRPTVTAQDLDQATGGERRVVWLGVALERNVRDIFEHNRSRTGQELDPETMRDPHLNEYMLMRSEDDVGDLMIKVDRWRFPKYKTALFEMQLAKDFLLVQGTYRPAAWARIIKASRIWIVEP